MKKRFHENLTLLRKRKGCTQLQMSEKLEIPRSTYTNYESGNRAPDYDTLLKIADTLECTLDELFGRTVRQSVSMIGESRTPYQAVTTNPQKTANKKLAIGLEDFRSMREKGAYYVDKTKMIPEFLNSEYQVTLITRPRRFGKTLNMSMLAEFLDCTKNSADIFAGTEVCQSDVMQEMNGHPTIFISFLNVKGDNANAMVYQLMRALEYEYRKYLPVIQDKKLSAGQRENLQNIYRSINRLKVDEESKISLADAIPALCQALTDYYEKKVYLLIDEYDTPFIAANSGGYYDEVRGLLAAVLSSSLKGNQALQKAMLTGIQRVGKENIFSGLNNLIVCTVNDPDFSDCFGFTEEETRELLKYYEMELTEEVKAMYDGYLFGRTSIYNPWSVTSYAVRKKMEPYWVNTSENSIIRNAMEESSESFIVDYEKLIEQGTAEVPLEMITSYFEQPDDASLWGLLVNAGLLTVMEHGEDNYYLVKVPNYEVRKEFQNLTAFHLKVQEGHIIKMVMNLKRGRMQEFAEEYQRIVLEVPSYHDLKNENSYHMMMLGMCAFMYKDYEVKSNWENGRGRGDILLLAKKEGRPYIILEFKYTKDESQNLEKLAQKAIMQIKERKYDAGMSGQVYYVGLAHCGKKTGVSWEER